MGWFFFFFLDVNWDLTRVLKLYIGRDSKMVMPSSFMRSNSILKRVESHVEDLHLIAILCYHINQTSYGDGAKTEMTGAFLLRKSEWVSPT